MAVAAAIGVGTDDSSNNGGSRQIPGSNNALSQRLSNKMKMMTNASLQLPEINRSIEKMSIGNGYSTNGGVGGGGGVGNQHCGMPPTPMSAGRQGSMPNTAGGQTMPTNTTRRGSNWTNSTEGYGSMPRSEQSRRCSDVSVAMSQSSNISTRAMGSFYDPMSQDNSRRSSMVSNPGSVAGTTESHAATPNIGHHLNRLHRRAQQQVMQGSTPAQAMMLDGRVSGMSDVTATNPTPTNPPMPTMVAQMQPHGEANNSNSRRASDPCRTLDRTFGVDGNLSRHSRRGSYDQMNMGQQTRVPLHGQRIRGTSGDTFFHGHPMVRIEKLLLNFL